MTIGWGLDTRTLEDLAIVTAKGRISDAGLARLEAALLPSPTDPPISRDLLRAGWLAEQWDFLRAIRGEIEFQKHLGNFVGPVGRFFLPTGRTSVIEGWSWLREFEASEAADHPIATLGDFTKANARLRAAAKSESLVVQFFALLHEAPSRVLPGFLPRLEEHRNMLRLNLALRRYRTEHGADPAKISELLPSGFPTTTSEGPWSWWSSIDESTTWIGRGPQEYEVPTAEQIENLERFIERFEDDD